MKLYYAFLACCLAATQFASAQNNFVVFSADGLKFYLLLNGEQQNQTPKANIKITGLTDPALKAKIIFEDNTMANIDQTIYFNDEEPNTEYAYEIKNKKGKYKLGYFSVKPIAEVKPNATQQVIIYGQPETVTTVITTTTTNTNTTPVVVNTNTNTTNTTVTNTNTTTNPQTITKPNNNANVSVNVNDNTNSNPNNDPNFNMNINIGGDPNNPNFNMNVNVNENGNTNNNNANPNDNFNMNVNVNENGNTNTNVNTNTTNTNTTNTNYSTTTTTTSTTTTTKPVVVEPAAKNKCAVSMTADQCTKAAAKVKATSFDSDQLKAANTAVEKNCATTAQIKQIAKEMKFEDSKTQFLKNAYSYCTDQQNYDELLDVLKHSSDREAVEKIMK